MKWCYGALFSTVFVSFILKNSKLNNVMLVGTCVMAYHDGVVNATALGELALFYGLSNYCYYNKDNRIATAALLAITMLFSLHKLPGFKNEQVINNLSISTKSASFSMYLNFDKVMAALILYSVFGINDLESKIGMSAAFNTAIMSSICIGVVASIGLASNIVKFDFKKPYILPLWCANNLLFVSMSEEVIFRGLVQDVILKPLISDMFYRNLASSAVFGLYHFKSGGPVMMLASAVAGCFYGYAYEETTNLKCSIVVHFALNLAHMLCFTYPYSVSLQKN